MFGVGNRQGICIVLSSPSGAGKTTISRMLLESDDELTMSISCTTRPARANEVDGKDYYFVTQEKFDEMKNNGEFLEHAEVFGHCYGTPRHFVEDQLNQSRDVVFDIDWQGTKQLAKTMKESLVSIFILPPSMGELENRLRQRALDAEAVVRGRMAKAASEISHWDEYDYVVVNYDLDKAMVAVDRIVKAERLRRKRYPQMQQFVKHLLES